MSNENTETKFDRSSFLSSVTGEITKGRREALKGKVKGLLQKREEAQRAIRLIDDEIEQEIAKFEAGLS